MPRLPHILLPLLLSIALSALASPPARVSQPVPQVQTALTPNADLLRHISIAYYPSATQAYDYDAPGTGLPPVTQFDSYEVNGKTIQVPAKALADAGTDPVLVSVRKASAAPAGEVVFRYGNGDAVTISSRADTLWTLSLARPTAGDELAGAVVNIGVNTAIEVSPEFNTALTIYNGAMGAVGLYHTASGLYKVSAKLPQLLSENKNIRAIIIAKYADWQVAINAAGDLSDAERQLLTKQEKVWELLGVKELAKTGSRFIAKSGAELKTHLNSITNKPLGKSYTGKWYRYTGNPNYNPTEIYSGMIDAENRFRKGLYLSETKSGNIIEANSYGGTSGKTLFEISDVEVSNLLDLTDANTIEVLGTTFEQMKLTGVTNAYEYTQEIAIWAKNNGYSGIKFYGGQGGTSSYTNFVIFEQSTINNSIKGSVNVIPW